MDGAPPAGTQTGDYRATDLKASGKWEAGQSSGAFTYSYPLKFPPAPYGKAPELAFSYNSQSVDGRTSGENNQASWAGMGWELQSGFIERKYKACANDADAGQDALKTWGDLCWDSPVKGKDDGAVYVISLNGHTSELIWDSVSKHYRMKDDQDWKIEHPTTGGQGADSEYWIITAPDGTKSYLGYGADPTKTANNATNSVWTVPVIGDDSGEPCYTTSTPASMQPCDQAYRWNLDRVVDPNGNESVFYYNAETNTYKRHQGGAIVRYNRGGYLTRIEYGLREDAAKDTPATNQVEFASNNRCVERNREPDPYTNQPAACPTVATGGATSYPDVPVDLVCDTTCTKESPSFFIVRQLSQIVTKARRIDGAAGYDNVATYQMKFSFPGTGDTTSESLWLDYIRPVGHMGNGPDLKMPVTGFNGANLNNIAESGKPSMNMRRIVSIENELGGNSKVTYGLPDACNTALTDWSGEKNLKDCFRSFYKPEGAAAGQWGIFNKYVVTQVTDVDRVSGQPDQTTSYEYGGGAGWHFDDDLNRPDNDESWSDWRGYKTVKAIKGTSSDKTQRTTTTTTFFRGLNNDRTNNGDTAAKRSEKLTDFDGNIVDDDHFLTGRTLQTRTWTDTDALTDVTSTRNTYWHSAMTADGPGFHNAYMVRPDGTTTRARKQDGTYRVTAADTSFDTHGRATKSLSKGDTTDLDDDRCTTTEYADNTAGGRWMLVFPETVTLHTGSCAGATAGKTVTLYDGATAPGIGNKPTAGLATETRTYRDAADYKVAKGTYDKYGRPQTTTAPNGTASEQDDTTTLTYQPADGWPSGGIKTVNPLGHTTWTIPDRRDGATTKTVDANNNVTVSDYDKLGRLIRVWGPTEPKPANPAEGKPTVQFTYITPYAGITAPTGPTIVKSEKLQSGDARRPNWLASWGYLDGFGRTFETQTRSPSGTETGRMVNVTRYDDRGLVAGATQVPAYNSAAAGSGPLNPDQGVVPSWTAHAYDAAQREREATLWAAGTKKWSTLTAPAADTTIVTPPSGGKDATSVDAFGNKTAITEDHGTPDAATTRYSYTVRNERSKITDADGNVTQTTYNWAGERLSNDDPDAGRSTNTYDKAGNLASSVDAKNQKISYTYDALNRRTGQWSGEANTGTRLAECSFDPRGALGQPSAAIRYINGQQYRTDVLGYDARYRPTGERTTIPATEGALAGNYDTTYAYDKADHVTDITYPAAGGLPAEKVSAKYSPNTGVPLEMTSDLSGDYTYVKHNYYWSTGELAQRNYGKNGGIARAYTYEDPTGRLSRIKTITGNDTATKTDLQNDTYTYDPTGNVTDITDQLIQTGVDDTPQHQCFTYDGTDRLKEAWTTTTAPNCAAGSSTADNGGPDPYKLAYTYTKAGNIQQVTDGTTARTYTYPPSGTTAVRPHAVTKISDGTHSDTYAYDDAGQMTSRTVAAKTTTLDWDELNKLSAATTGTSKTTFAYDADGNRIIRRDPGTATLYLENMEVRSNGTATRYDTLGKATVALRKTGDPAATWLLSDTQASAQLAIEGWTSKVARQRYLPFGAHRGGRDDITATERGFLGKTEDPTTALVATDNRYYDPFIGRFLSPDPLGKPERPQSLTTPTATPTTTPPHPATPTASRPATSASAPPPNKADAPPYSEAAPTPTPTELPTAWGRTARHLAQTRTSERSGYQGRSTFPKTSISIVSGKTSGNSTAVNGPATPVHPITICKSTRM